MDGKKLVAELEKSIKSMKSREDRPWYDSKSSYKDYLAAINEHLYPLYVKIALDNDLTPFKFEDI
jgi:hypothetical protein